MNYETRMITGNKLNSKIKEYKRKIIKPQQRKFSDNFHLETLLKNYKPCMANDIVLIDSSIINLGNFFEKYHSSRIDSYKTEDLEQVRKTINLYEEFIKKENIRLTDKVYKELEELDELITYRVKNGQVPKLNYRRKYGLKVNEKTIKKSVRNKQILEEIQKTYYQIQTTAKRKIIKPSKDDRLLFKIINNISSYRMLKENKIAKNNYNYTNKEHDFESSTDEWLVAQAYNQIIFNEKKVSLLSNDDDIARIIIDTEYFLNRPFLKGKLPQLNALLREIRPLEFGSPLRQTYSNNLNDKQLYKKFGYVRGKRDIWRMIEIMTRGLEKKLIKEIRKKYNRNEFRKAVFN